MSLAMLCLEGKEAGVTHFITPLPRGHIAGWLTSSDNFLKLGERFGDPVSKEPLSPNETPRCS